MQRTWDEDEQRHNLKHMLYPGMFRDVGLEMMMEHRKGKNKEQHKSSYSGRPAPHGERRAQFGVWPLAHDGATLLSADSG